MQKSFDCVKTMRDIRAKLSKRYAEHPELLDADMAEIRRKYGFPEPARKPKPALVAEEQAPCGGGGPSGKWPQGCRGLLRTFAPSGQVSGLAHLPDLPLRPGVLARGTAGAFLARGA